MVEGATYQLTSEPLPRSSCCLAMLDFQRFALDSLTIPVVRLMDPRSRRQDRFCFQYHIEHVLYGGPTGGLYRLLGRASLGSSTLTLNKAAVLAGVISADAFQQIVALLSESLPFESQVRPATHQKLAPCPPTRASARCCRGACGKWRFLP